MNRDTSPMLLLTWRPEGGSVFLFEGALLGLNPYLVLCCIFAVLFVLELAPTNDHWEPDPGTQVATPLAAGQRCAGAPGRWPASLSPSQHGPGETIPDSARRQSQTESSGSLCVSSQWRPRLLYFDPCIILTRPKRSLAPGARPVAMPSARATLH